MKALASIVGQGLDVEPLHLGAIHYQEGEGAAIDLLLAELALVLAQDGVRLAGAVQHNTRAGDRRCCDMVLQDLATGRKIVLSEYRGPEAKGCRLDSRALEEVVGLSADAIEKGADLLIVNKFGKRECEGRGFRNLIDAALEAGIAVLVAVNQNSAEAWTSYAQGLDIPLPLYLDVVADWCSSSIKQKKKYTPSMEEAPLG